jgi:hypothetical protein
MGIRVGKSTECTGNQLMRILPYNIFRNNVIKYIYTAGVSRAEPSKGFLARI